MKAEILLAIKAEARKYTRETFREPSAEDYLMIENAMLKAAIIATEEKRETQ